MKAARAVQASFGALASVNLTNRARDPYDTADAQVAELVDALVSGTSGASRGGSSPLLGTIPERRYPEPKAPSAVSPLTPPR